MFKSYHGDFKPSNLIYCMKMQIGTALHLIRI